MAFNKDEANEIYNKIMHSLLHKQEGYGAQELFAAAVLCALNMLDVIKFCAGKEAYEEALRLWNDAPNIKDRAKKSVLN